MMPKYVTYQSNPIAQLFANNVTAKRNYYTGYATIIVLDRDCDLFGCFFVEFSSGKIL
jgi:hypothetical protein